MCNIPRVLVFMALTGLPGLAAASDEGDPAKAHSVEKLIGAMSDNERVYYYQSFDYAMTNAKPGGKYEWASYGGNGYFTVDAPFVHRSTVCRNFRETITNPRLYTVSSEGAGCKRLGAEGWCKLKKGDALTCDMESSQGILDAPDVQGVIDNTVNSIKQDVNGGSVPDAPSIPGVAGNPTGGATPQFNGMQPSQGAPRSPGVAGAKQKVDEIGNDVGNAWSRWWSR